MIVKKSERRIRWVIVETTQDHIRGHSSLVEIIQIAVTCGKLDPDNKTEVIVSQPEICKLVCYSFSNHNSIISGENQIVNVPSISAF